MTIENSLQRLDTADVIGISVAYTQPMEPIGKKIERLRRARDWSQEALAEAAGVDQGKVSTWEKGPAPTRGRKPGARPSWKSLAKLAPAFGLSVSDLIKGTDLDPGSKNVNLDRESGLPLIPSPVYDVAASSSSSLSKTKGGQGEGTGGDPYGFATLRKAAREHWEPPADQEGYGRDLIRAAVFLEQLGRALTRGEARIVSTSQPEGSHRGSHAGGRLSELPTKKSAGRRR